MIKLELRAVACTSANEMSGRVFNTRGREGEGVGADAAITPPKPSSSLPSLVTLTRRDRFVRVGRGEVVGSGGDKFREGERHNEF